MCESTTIVVAKEKPSSYSFLSEDNKIRRVVGLSDINSRGLSQPIDTSGFKKRCTGARIFSFDDDVLYCKEITTQTSKFDIQQSHLRRTWSIREG